MSDFSLNGNEQQQWKVSEAKARRQIDATITHLLALRANNNTVGKKGILQKDSLQRINKQSKAR